MRDSRKTTLVAVVGLALLSATAAIAMGQREGIAVDAAPVAAAVAAPSPPVPSPTSDSDGTRQATQAAVPRIDRGWLARTARLAMLPPVALRAYARAQQTSPPGCELGWTTLAGIGWVESQHGTIGRRVLHADGRSSAPIVGPALDGRGPVAEIRSSASGTTLHGDPTWDHAVGPMQFLPATWDQWATDGDGDGRADPQDLDDSAAAAAAYLCADGRRLTGVGWSAAVLSYNHDAGYVRAVFAAAQAYSERTR